MSQINLFKKWLIPGLGVKRWFIVLLSGIILTAIGLASLIVHVSSSTFLNSDELNLVQIGALTALGGIISIFGLYKLSHNLLAPYRLHQSGHVIDVVYAHSKRQKGLRVVAIGGGTGLPAVLRGLKSVTSNITAVVTVADDGGSSGRLRRDLGVLPPGDLRNNIAALADDESLMTQLFQYRFEDGDLQGHSFGNLFIAALSGISGGLEPALTEVGRVLNVQGTVLPSTLEDINLSATIRINGKSHPLKVQGESKISEVGGQIEHLSLIPEDANAYTKSVNVILDADLVVIGPGSLYTSIIPNLLVKGIADALRATSAYKVYICNVATQPGETGNFNVADHVLALEKHIGRGVFQAVLANNTYPSENAGRNTFYVEGVPTNHEILQRYEVRYTDLTDEERPWRHDPQKLARAILSLNYAEKTGSNVADPIFANV